MKINVKKVGLYLATAFFTLGAIQTYDYYRTKYETKQLLEESEKKKHEAEQNLKKLNDAFDKLEKSMQEQLDFMGDLCFAFWQENKIPSDVAVIQCKCEKELYEKTMPVGDIWFVMENIEKFDFLLYKKDVKAVEIMDTVKSIRKKCTEREKDKINAAFKKNK